MGQHLSSGTMIGVAGFDVDEITFGGKSSQGLVADGMRTTGYKHGMNPVIFGLFSAGMSIPGEPDRREARTRNPPAFASFLYKGDAHALHDHRQGHP